MYATMLFIGRLLFGVSLAGGVGMLGYLIAFVAIHSFSLPSPLWLRMVQILCTGIAAGAAGAVAWTPEEETMRGRASRFLVSITAALVGSYIGVEMHLRTGDDTIVPGLRWLLMGSVMGASLAGMLTFAISGKNLFPFRLMIGWLTKRHGPSNAREG